MVISRHYLSALALLCGDVVGDVVMLFSNVYMETKALNVRKHWDWNSSSAYFAKCVTCMHSVYIYVPRMCT